MTSAVAPMHHILAPRACITVRETVHVDSHLCCVKHKEPTRPIIGSCCSQARKLNGVFAMAAAASNPASAAAPEPTVLLYLHESREDPPERHPQCVSLAFEAQQFPVLVEKYLLHSDPVVVSKALKICLTHLPQPMNVAKALAAGILKPLAEQSAHAESSIRGLVSGCLHKLCGDRAGGAPAVSTDEGILSALKALCKDDAASTRGHAYEAILGVASTFSGATGLVKAGFVPHLVARAAAEHDTSLLGTILAALVKCVNAHGQEGVLAALDGDCVAVVTKLLAGQLSGSESVDTCIVRGAAGTLMWAAVPQDGKRQLIEAGALPLLLHALSGELVPSDSARAAAAGALMNAVVDDAGKRVVLDEGIQPLLDALQSSAQAYGDCGQQLSLLLNTLRAVATLAAHPLGRRAALDAGVLHTVDTLITPAAKEANQATLERLAGQTRKVLDWSP